MSITARRQTGTPGFYAGTDKCQKTGRFLPYTGTDDVSKLPILPGYGCVGAGLQNLK
jgi:hypothetical protein